MLANQMSAACGNATHRLVLCDPSDQYAEDRRKPRKTATHVNLVRRTSVGESNCRMALAQLMLLTLHMTVMALGSIPDFGAYCNRIRATQSGHSEDA